MKRSKGFLKFLIILITLLIINVIPVFAKSSIDVVFIIDRSGSMGDDIEGVRDNIGRFVDKMVAQGIDYRLGLVTYEVNVSRYDFTKDVQQFKNNLSNICIDGGTENGLDAISEAIDGFTYDENSVKYFVLIGDEPITSYCGYSNSNIQTKLKENKVILTAIGEKDCGYNQFNSLADYTGGLIIDINSGSYNEKLETIFNQIQNIPIVEILKPIKDNWYSNNTPTCIPQVKVSDPDSDNLTLKCYIDSNSTPYSSLSVTNTKEPMILDFDSLDVSILSEGVHKLKIDVDDGSDIASDYVYVNIDKSSPTINNIKTIPTNDTITLEITSRDSNSGLANKPYKVNLVNNENNDWQTSNTVTFNNLNPNTNYKFSIKVKDRAENVKEKILNINTTCSQPSIECINKSDNTASMHIVDNNPATTQYLIEVSGKFLDNSGNLSNVKRWITLKNKKCIVKGLSQNILYKVRVKAKDGSNTQTSWSSIIKVTTLPNCPKGFIGSPSQNHIKFKWNSIPNVNGYEIECNGNIYKVVDENQYTLHNLKVKTIYNCRIRTLGEGGKSCWSDNLIVTTLPNVPEKIESINVVDEQQTSLKLEWETVEETDYYEISVNEDIVKQSNTNSIVLDNLQVETEYVIKIRGVNIGGSGEWSEDLDVATLPSNPDKPINFTQQITKNSILIKWDSVTNAEGYIIEIDGIRYDIGDATQYLHEGLEPVSGHTYKVKATRANGRVEGEWSEVLDITTHPEKPNIPNNIICTSNKNSLSLVWYAVSYAEKYLVEIDKTKTIELDTNNFTHNNLLVESTHSYRVKAVNITGESEWSKPITATTLQDMEQSGSEENYTITNLAAFVTNNNIVLSWDAIDFEGDYELEVDGILKNMKNTTSYVHSGLTPNENHSYRIRINTGDKVSNWCVNVTLSTLSNPPGIPVNLTTKSENNKIELRWDAIDDAEEYEIEIDGTYIKSTTKNIYIHEDLKSGTSHIYRVRAKNEIGITAWSSALTEKTDTPNYTISADENEEFELTLLVDNIQDFETNKFLVEYDKEKVDLIDLFDMTPLKDVKEGIVPETDLSFTYTETGGVLIEVNKRVQAGKSFTGEITTLKLKSKVNDEIVIKVSIVK